MGNITQDLIIKKNIVSSILRKELSIIGTWNSRYRPNKSDDMGKALKMIQDGFKPSSLVTHVVSLDEIPSMLKKLYQHKKRIKKFKFIKVMYNNN